jgi:hypothetical protein
LPLVPFLPVVLLLAWQAVSKSASFALGWATAMYFGQVPGRQGRILSVISLLAAGWVIVVIGFAIPIFSGAILEATGVIGENFDVRWIHYLALVAAIVLAPPVVAGAAVWGEFHEDRSWRRWLRMIPMSYPATAMLGLSVLQMVVITPFLLVMRLRQQRKLVQVPLMMHAGCDDDDMVDLVRRALATIDIDDVSAAAAEGPRAWPLRTVGFAVEHLLGAVVRGEPMRLQADDLEILAYATNIAILGPKQEAYRARAAILRMVTFADAYLTWSDDARDFEDALRAAHDEADGDLDELRGRFDQVQSKMDVASLNSEEWNVLYRMRLELEADAARQDDGASRRMSA